MCPKVSHSNCSFEPLMQEKEEIKARLVSKVIKKLPLPRSTKPLKALSPHPTILSFSKHTGYDSPCNSIKDSSSISTQNTLHTSITQEPSENEEGILFECTESLPSINKLEPLERDDAYPFQDICQSYLNTNIQIEPMYLIDPYYIQDRQPHINKVARCILMSWIMEVCCERHLKRQTYYLTINYIDRFLSCSEFIKKEDLQLVGISALHLASKMEDYKAITAQALILFANNTYSNEQLLDMSESILKALKWKLNPPTLFLWGNTFMSQWDLFISTSASQNMITFKKNSPEDYKHFREVMQIIDSCSLIIDTFQFNVRVVALSALYIILAIHYTEQNGNQMPEDEKSMRAFCNISCALNDKFNEFLLKWGIESNELFQSEMELKCTKLSFDYSEPTDMQGIESFEEMATIQTYNQKQLNFIQHILAN